LERIRRSGIEADYISYLYVMDDDGHTLIGAVDLRELLLTAAEVTLGEIMATPVVSAKEGDTFDDLTELFSKYHYRMLPVTDDNDKIIGVILYDDIMKSAAMRVKI